MKSFHIILKNHKLGQELGYKNIDIAKSFGLDASVFDGIPGNDCKHIFKQHKILHGSRGISGIGQRGCFLSHYLLWRHCIKLNESIAILEHDGVFLRPLPENVEEQFTDVCRLEAYRHWDPEYENLVTGGIDKNVEIKKLSTEFRNRYTGEYYIGYYGYLIKPSGAQKLVQHAKHAGICPVDQYVATGVVDIVSTIPSVVRLEQLYIGRVDELSTTSNFDNAYK
jgi:glycosyl transferase, family 25